MAGKRPTQRTMELLRAEGHDCDVVERFLRIPSHPGGGVRKDLFGGIDLVAMIDYRIVGIQCGAMSGHSEHKKKLLAESRMLAWVQCQGARLFIYSWGKQGARGKAKRWTCRIEELTVNDFVAPPELNLFA